MADDVTKVVDAKGMSCPMPVLLAKRAADEVEAGNVIRIEATDAGSKSDIPSWTRDRYSSSRRPRTLSNSARNGRSQVGQVPSGPAFFNSRTFAAMYNGANTSTSDSPTLR